MLKDVTDNLPQETKVMSTAWKVALVALGVPFLLTIEGAEHAYRAGQLLRWVIVTWVLSWALVKLLAKGKSEHARAQLKLYGSYLTLVTAIGVTSTGWAQDRRLTADLKALTSAHGAIMSAQDVAAIEEISRTVITLPGKASFTNILGNSTTNAYIAVLNALMPLAVDFKRAMFSVEQKFESLGQPLERLLEPPTLVSKVGIDQNRETLRALSKVIDERDEAFQTYWAQAEKLINSSTMTTKTKEVFLRDLGKGAEQEKAIAELSAATRTYIEIARAIVDLAANAGAAGQIRVVGGELRFDSKAESSRHQELQRQLEAAANREEAAQKAFQTLVEAKR